MKGRLIRQILYSMPVSADRMEDLNNVQQRIGSKAVVRCMVDHPEQVKGLGEFSKRIGRKEKWSVFVKVDGGGR